MSDEEKITSRSNIENLPHEILVEIFTYLSSRELKSVMLSSQMFANIIGDCTRLMRKFYITITKKRKWDFTTLTNLERKHQMIKFIDFSMLESLDGELSDGLYNIGGNLKTLELIDCNIETCNFTRILDATPQLTHLNVIHTKIIGEMNEIISLKSLACLKVINSELSYEIFENTLSLREILIEVNECQNVDLNYFQKFLFHQSKLKSLMLINLRLSNLFDMKMNCDFQLESLEIYNCHFRHKENFEIFLENQRFIKEIELSICSMKLGLDRVRYFESIIDCILRKELLKSLTLKIEDYKFSNFIFLQITTIENLNLSLKDTNFSSSNFLKYFPYLKSLELDFKELENDDVELISKLSLDHLKVSSFSSECFGKLKLKNLTSLWTFETTIDALDWMKFVDNNPKITKLVINFSLLMDFDVNLLSFLTQRWKNLVHVELVDKYLGFENEIYKMICENCKNLRYLKLWNINIEKDFDESDKEYLRERNVKFHLFNDESLNKPMIPF